LWKKALAKLPNKTTEVKKECVNLWCKALAKLPCKTKNKPEITATPSKKKGTKKSIKTTTKVIATLPADNKATTTPLKSGLLDLLLLSSPF
jgi:hypothetical protein